MENSINNTNSIEENIPGIAQLKVVGIGGAGGNAVNDMLESGITGVDFIAINTDLQDLNRSKTQTKVLLGKGTGAGAIPERGRIAAKESEEKIKEVLEGTDMLFITAGMGGGTGTGASPVVAEIAKSMGILTVAVVTKPFDFEGPFKRKNADEGVENLKKFVDTLIVIPNQQLYKLPKINISLRNAFKEANNVLRIGIKGISDLITKQGFVNLDFADVKTVMKDSGIAMLGFGEASGDGRAKAATEQALNSPLLEKSIEGARKILLNITSGEDMGLDEVTEVSETIYKKTGNAEATLIWGAILEKDGNEIEESQGNFDKPKGYFRVSLIATDFQDDEVPVEEVKVEMESVEHSNESTSNELEELNTPEENSQNDKRPGQGEYVVPSFFEQNSD
jgi:cell division protein ftsZ